jgi:hypothetical protein
MLVSALPLVCALFVMSAAFLVSVVLMKGSDGDCCTAKDLVLQPSANAQAQRAAGTLTPDMYSGRARYIAAVQVQLVAIATAVCVGTFMLLRLVRKRPGRIAFVLLVLAFGAISAGLLINERQSPAFHALMLTTVAREFPVVEDMRFVLERSTAVAATVLGGIASLFLLPQGRDLEALRRTAAHYRSLTYLLAIGTFLLGADVLARTVLGMWATTYFDDKVVDSLVESIVAGWGVYDSLFLAAIFIPTALVLRFRIQELTANVDRNAPPDWFDAQLLSESPLQILSRAGAILTPFLVGQASNLLQF